MTHRLQNIDLVKLITIILVLIGHTLMHLRSNESYHNELFLIIYSFHMPLFMALVGFFAKSTINLKVGSFLKKKIRQLLFPTITWCFTFWLFNLIILRYEEYMSFGEIYNSTFWFLKSAFICYVLFYCGCKISHSILWGSLFTLLISQILPFFSIEKMYPAFLTGVLLSIKRDKLYNIPLYLTLICFCIFFLVFVNVQVPEVLLTKFKLYSFWNDQISIMVELRRHFIGLVLGLSAAIGIIIFSFSSIGKRLTDKTSILSKYGQYTLGIYCIQTFLLKIIMRRYVSLDGVDHYTFTYVLSPLISFFILIVCICIIIPMEKNKYFKFIYLGGPNPIVYSQSFGK